MKMGLFDRFQKRTDVIAIEQLIREPYEQTYLNECKFIWKNYVPKRGQSDVLQGELLRDLEKLRCEAQDNGNRNWDDDFVYFCDFLKETLCRQKIYSENEKNKFSLILDYIKDCGNYARRWNDRQIPDDEVDANRITYTEDNLYDIVADAIGFLHIKAGGPIPFQKDGKISR